MNLVESFTHVFQHPPDGVWQAPGRVNLIGEHTDYNRGLVLPFAIDRQAHVAVRIRDDQQVHLVSTASGKEEMVSCNLRQAHTVSGWPRYILGVAWALEQRGITVPGFELYLDSTVPIGAGLSSSAAVECAVAIALNDLLNTNLSPEELVLITQQAENVVVGAPTGILDQSASLLAADQHALFLDCLNRHTTLVPLDLPAAGLTVLVIDTKVSHSHAEGGYASRRASCERAAQWLGIDSLRTLTTTDLPEVESILAQYDPRGETYRRVKHVVTENSRVESVVDLLHSGEITGIGSFLNSSHASLRDDFDVSCPELDLAVSTAQSAGAWGARMTGGGFGGSAIALIPEAAVPETQQAVVEAFAAADFQTPDMFRVSPSAGAHRLI